MGITQGDTVVAITHDGDGNRVRTVITDTGGVTATVHIGGYYEWSAGSERKYYYHNGQRVAMRDGSGLYWLLTDHLGSTAVVATSSGAWAGELRYTAWGETRESSGALPTDYRFTGQCWQDRIGLYDYQARWYDPSLGRFVQPDTLVPEPENPQSLNRFSYCLNNPVRYIDPTGHDPSDWDQDWEQRYYAAHGQMPGEQDWLEYKFSLQHPGSGPNGAWTADDWKYFNLVKQELGPLVLFIGQSPGTFGNGATRLGLIYEGLARGVRMPMSSVWPGPDETDLVQGWNRIPQRAGGLTLGERIYIPSDFWTWPADRTKLFLVHEYVHVLQYRFKDMEMIINYRIEGFYNWPDRPGERTPGANSYEIQASMIEHYYSENPGLEPLWLWVDLPI